jgi:phosphatidylserine decarboxylase
MPIHREGYPTLALVGAALLILNLLLPCRVVRMASAAILVFFAQFFRNPRRIVPNCSNCIIAPADGTVVALERVREDEYFHDERLKISIYMSALNVHLNRVPVSGRVVYTRYHPGKYLVAFHPKASELNERNTIVFEDAQGRPILVRQIAGILARRIVTYMNTGDSVQVGDELGFIKFGSRCDVFLPLDAQVQIQMQDRIKGGETILAKL